MGMRRPVVVLMWLKLHTFVREVMPARISSRISSPGSSRMPVDTKFMASVVFRARKTSSAPAFRKPAARSCTCVKV